MGGRVLREAVLSILLNGYVDRLGRLGLELYRGDGKSVDKEHKVDGVLVAAAVEDLPNDTQNVAVIEGSGFGIEGAAGLGL